MFSVMPSFSVYNREKEINALNTFWCYTSDCSLLPFDTENHHFCFWILAHRKASFVMQNQLILHWSLRKFHASSPLLWVFRSLSLCCSQVWVKLFADTERIPFPPSLPLRQATPRWPCFSWELTIKRAAAAYVLLGEADRERAQDAAFINMCSSAQSH